MTWSDLVPCLKSALKSALRPVREAGESFLNIQDSEKDSIIWKAAQIVSAELIEGDYVEFGVFRGSSIITAFSTIKDV
ncbi:MAG: hypothetical protein KGM47_12990 [Acidobacteriota bacterium]|nr:hypothetical protein [Acidobacteriota bacterium]